MAKKKARRRVTRVPEAPTCNCVLLCDDVLRSAKGKHVLSGVIGVIQVARLPAVIGGFVMYVRVSNVYGTQSVRFTFSGPDAEEILSATVPVNQPDPLGVHTVVSPLPQFPVEKSGRYMLQVESGGVPIAATPVEIVELQAVPEG